MPEVFFQLALVKDVDILRGQLLSMVACRGLSKHGVCSWNVLKTPKLNSKTWNIGAYWGILSSDPWISMGLLQIQGTSVTVQFLFTVCHVQKGGARGVQSALTRPIWWQKNRPTSFINVHQAPSLGPFAGLLNPAAQTNTIFQGVSGNANETVSGAKIIPVESFCEDLEGTLKVLVAGCKQMLLEKPPGKLFPR
jgi:hypothetical protein